MFGLLYLFKGDLVKIVIATDGSLGSSETISNLSEIRLKETQKDLKKYQVLLCLISKMDI